MSALFPVVLVIRLAMFPDMVPIHYESFERERHCDTAMKELQSTTKVPLLLSCEVDT